jgi:cytochrome P450
MKWNEPATLTWWNRPRSRAVHGDRRHARHPTDDLLTALVHAEDEGDMLSGLGSANRDERFFGPDASEVRVRRDNARQHVSFGAGPHHCLGASLARLEASIALHRLLGRFPALALDGDADRNGRITLRGPARLPVLAG